jgi:hypothetical protein
MVIIPFTRKRNIMGLKEPNLFSKAIQLTSEAKYLGLMLEKGITREKQLGRVINKEYRGFWQQRSMFKKTWELKPRML